MLALFSHVSGSSPEAAQAFSESLDRLSCISGDDFRSVPKSVRNTYADFSLLEEDLAQLADSAPAVQAVWAYLDCASVPSELAELSIERLALAVAVASASLLVFSRPRPALAQQITDFKGHYATAFRSLHQELNRSLSAYRRDFDAAKLMLRALDLLNNIPDLGQSTGIGFGAGSGRAGHVSNSMQHLHQ